MFSLLLIYTLDIIAIKVGFFTEQIILADADSAADIFDNQQEREDAADGQQYQIAKEYVLAGECLLESIDEVGDKRDHGNGGAKQPEEVEEPPADRILY